MDIGTSVDESIPPAPNTVLLELRKSKGWGRPRLAKELHNFCISQNWPSPGEANLAKQIYRLETGRIRTPDDFYTRLYCQYYRRTEHELFGRVETSVSKSQTYRLRSHKFIPVYVGVDGVSQIRETRSMFPDETQWSECYSTRIDNYGDSCRLYTWPFGVAMFHLVEELQPRSIAELSVWRRLSYRENIDWASAELTTMTGRLPADEPYVLSAYWVQGVPCDGARLHTALRLLCIPRTLIERDDNGRRPSQAHAELVEQELLREGFDHPEIVNFGIKGISAAYASWSGVVYHSLAPKRSLNEEELVRCELTVQAMWTYCHYIRTEVEKGRDPVVSDQYGWRFLRGARSRVTTERPQETSQHRSMRDVVVQTSGLDRHLTQTVETLREIDGG